MNLHGRLHQLRDEFVNEVLNLSKSLHLNQLRCVELLKYSLEQQNRYTGLNATQIALLLFFKDREILLTKILQLLAVSHEKFEVKAFERKFIVFLSSILF